MSAGAYGLAEPADSRDPLNAIYFENLTRLKLLIREDPKLKNLKNEDSTLNLPYSAVLMHSPKALRILIEEGVNINQANFFGVTPLHLAAYHNATEACQILVRAGASLTVVNRLGQTPVELAKERGSTECLGAMTK